MRVGQFEDLLARLPDDMLVTIAGGGPGLWHVGHIVKTNRRRMTPGPREIEGVLVDVVPPMLELSNGYHWDGRRRLWFHDEPDVLVRGRWPAPKPMGLR